MFGILKFIFVGTLLFFAAPPLLALAIPVLAVTFLLSVLGGCLWFLYMIFVFATDL